MKGIRALIVLVIFVTSIKTFSQGCSDGGVCSIGSLSILQFRFEEIPSDKFKLKKLVVEDEFTTFSKDGKKDSSKILVKSSSSDSAQYTADKIIGKSQPDSLSPNKSVLLFSSFPRYQFNLGAHYGIGERGTTIITTQLEVTAKLYRNKLFTQIKLPYTFVNGTLGKLSAPGDITFSFSYYARNKKASNLVFTAGTKIPTNNANLSLNSLPLPMPYQTSLGSVDLLLGAKYGFKNWEFLIAYQHSFNANENQYLHLPLVVDSTKYNNFFESNKMKRADDGVFRINKNFKIKNTILSAGALFIYHMQEDSYVNKLKERVRAADSDGLTLNLNISGVFRLNSKTDLTLIAASPLVNRKTRTDGLTRSFVLNVGLRWNVF